LAWLGLTAPREPIALDPDRELLLNGESKSTVRSIFTGEVVKSIERPAFKPAIDLSNFVDARFLPSGALKLWYTGPPRTAGGGGGCGAVVPSIHSQPNLHNLETEMTTPAQFRRTT
jgi:hypothetical protein